MMESSISRRSLMATAAGAVAGAAAKAAEAPLPSVQFGPHKISKLLIGTNPLMGYSHFNSILDQTMREWMTPDRRVETVLRAEAAGITTWQLHYHLDTMAIVDEVRRRGSKMQMFLLSDFELQKDFNMIPAVARKGFLGMAHHGNRTDDAFRAKNMDRVKEFVMRVKDAGLMAGVSMHNPEVMDYIEDSGWPVDYYMTCFYRVSRSREEARALMNGEAPLGETFLERDPDRMSERIKRTKRPCFGFKILAAGRAGFGREQIETAFKGAFERIKPNDAVIVGMFPKFKNEMQENASIVRSLLAG
ncbi:MAG TPA: hypothetical protein PLZ95_13185 [Bryobacteraceae bacterium]|nr:hypothetical protein [Bryobacteraceae bacterium]